MAAHIPFVNTLNDCKILKNYYRNSDFVRVSLETINKIESHLPSNLPLWMDIIIAL